MSNPNANVRKFDGAVNAAAYWIYDHLLRAGDIVNDSTVTGTTVKAALNTLSAASSAVFPFVAAGLAEQDLVSYDAGAATWRNRTKVAALKGTGTNSLVIGTGSLAAGTNDIILGPSAGTATNTGSNNIGIGTDTLDGATMALSGMIAIGSSALTGALTNVANNAIGIGVGALSGLTSGANNTAVGYQAGDTITTGSNMTLLGYDADGDAAARSGCVVLGTNALATVDDTLVIRMGNTSTKEIVVTPVVTATPVATVSNLPLTVGGIPYTISLGPASYTYTSVRTTDQTIAVAGAVAVATTLSVSVPAGTYKFSYAGYVTRSTAASGSISINCSTAATVTFSGYSQINGSSAIVYLNDSIAVGAGTNGDIIYDTASVAKQLEIAEGTLTCAAACVFTIHGYQAGVQNITFHKGTCFSLTSTN